MSDQAWRENAACRGKPLAWWWPADSWGGDDVDRALEVCAGCPVLLECRAYALAHEREGVWGGLTEQERRKIRRRNGIRVTTPTEFDPEPDRAKRAARLWEGGWTVPEIAAELDVSAKSVHRYLGDAGFQSHPPPDRIKPRRSRNRVTKEIAS